MAYFKCKGGFKGFINITSTANATVTATIGSNSYSAVCDSSGVGQIKVKKKGAYTITSTGTYRTATATVVDKTPVTAVYTWGKYNIGSQYVPYVVNSNSEFSTNRSFGSGVYGYYSGGYTIDQTNGRFVLSNPAGVLLTTQLDSYLNTLKSNPGLYVGTAYSSGTAALAYNSATERGLSGSYITTANSGARIDTGSSYKYIRYCTTYGLTTQQIKGTFIENVTGTTLDAYPIDGISGSYWYTSI